MPPSHGLIEASGTDHGAPLYGNAIITTPALLQQEPEAVRGLIRGFIQGLRDTINTPAEAMTIIKKYDPLVNERVELERWLGTLPNFLTPEVKTNGFGVIKVDRLARHIDAVGDAFQLSRRPKLWEVFTDKYLPARQDRQLPDLK
jgi:NitT/TauT family transport system substrate-binding protein